MRSFKVIKNSEFKSNDIPPIYREDFPVGKKKVATSLTKTFQWKQLKYPVFSYKKLNKILRIEINNLNLILQHIENLQVNMHITKQHVTSRGMQLNIFINNTFNIKPKFDYLKHFIIIRDSQLELHDMAELDTALVQSEIQFLHYEDLEDLILLVPPSKRSFPVTESQINTCMELYNAYLNQNENLNYLTEDLDKAVEVYDHLIDILKEEMQKISIINLTTGQVEIFDDEIHDIICIRNNDNLAMFYTKKENKDEFIQFISKAIKNKEKI